MSLSVGQCNPSSFIEIGHSVRFVGITSDDLTLSVCYENGNHTVMGLFDVPTLGSSVSWIDRDDLAFSCVKSVTVNLCFQKHIHSHCHDLGTYLYMYVL